MARERASLSTPSRRRTVAGGLTQGWRKVSVLYLSASSTGSACECPARAAFATHPRGKGPLMNCASRLAALAPPSGPEEPRGRTGIMASGTSDQPSGARNKASGQTGWSEAATRRRAGPGIGYLPPRGSKENKEIEE